MPTIKNSRIDTENILPTLLLSLERDDDIITDIATGTSREEGVHWPQDHTDHHNSDRPSASTSTWQARGRGEPGIQACLLKTQGSLRNFPKREPNNKVDEEILKRHTDK